MVTPATIVSVIADTNVSSMTGDEAVIMGIKSGKYYSLNPVGTRFWEIIQKPTSVREAARIIASEFDVAAETAEKDLVELAQQLIREGFASTAGTA